MYQKWKKWCQKSLRKVLDQDTPDKNNLCQTQTICDKHRGNVTKKLTFRKRHRVSVTDTTCLWLTTTVYERHILSVIDIYYLWQNKTVFDRHILSVKHTDWLWQTQTVCDRHSFFVTDTYCLWQTYFSSDGKEINLCQRTTDTDCHDRNMLSVTDTQDLWQT